MNHNDARRDEHFMAEALELAARIPMRTWPNPPVGAIVVREGKVVGRGAHHGPHSRHAEIVALDGAGEAARGGTLYCTLEPCNHQGRTPPCAPAVAASGLGRVVVGVADPNPSVDGGGLDLLQDRGLDVNVGVLGEKALELIWPFVVTDAFARPYLVLKTATSLDGRFSRPRRQCDPARATPLYLTGETARRDVHVLRRWMDLVLVGEGTLQADRPQLDGRLLDETAACPIAEPAAGYADTDLSHGAGWDRSSYYVFAGRQSAPSQARAAVRADGGQPILCAETRGQLDPAALLAEAHACGLHTILLEGGPRLAAAFLRAGLVDRWVQYLAPVTLGEGPAWPASGAASAAECAFVPTRQDKIGRDLRLVFDRLCFGETLRRLTSGSARTLRERAERL